MDAGLALPFLLQADPVWAPPLSQRCPLRPDRPDRGELPFRADVRACVRRSEIRAAIHPTGKLLHRQGFRRGPQKPGPHPEQDRTWPRHVLLSDVRGHQHGFCLQVFLRLGDEPSPDELNVSRFPAFYLSADQMKILLFRENMASTSGSHSVSANFETVPSA